MAGTNDIIRTMVRGTYDIQKLRVGMGNRITRNFKSKLGYTEANGMTEDDLEKQNKKVLKILSDSYKRITDGIVADSNLTEGTDAVFGKFPSAKQFKGDKVISTWAELTLVEGYMSLLRDEERQFSRLGAMLTGIPIYDQFLSQVDGLGVQMAGVIISEIDISISEYPSSLQKYTGIDTVEVGRYVDDTGKEHHIPARDIELFRMANNNDKTIPYIVDGKYTAETWYVGRSRKDESLVYKEYQDKNGETKERLSITFNPFLKTKMIGVLGGSFLKGGRVYVDDKVMGLAKRIELAKSLNYKSEAKDSDSINDHLRACGHTVVVENTKYGQIYYDYKNRLNNMPAHKDKTDLHIHNMAIRYAVKRFLVDLYVFWRTLEGLPVSTEYSEGKLGIIHGKAKPAPSNDGEQPKASSGGKRKAA